MFKRFTELYNMPMLIVVLAVFYSLILTSPAITTVIGYIGGMVFMTLVALAWNSTALENWKWIKTGVFTDLTDNALSLEEQKVKRAKLGINPPLFIAGKNRYYYQENNFKRETKNDF